MLTGHRSLVPETLVRKDNDSRKEGEQSPEAEDNNVPQPRGEGSFAPEIGHSSGILREGGDTIEFEALV